MDLFSLTKSKTRQKILDLFLSHPGKDYYLRELEKELSISAGNLRREFISLLKTGLFQKYSRGRFVYYKMNTKSIPYQAIKMLMNKNVLSTSDIIATGFLWTAQSSPLLVSDDLYCQTRDVFQARLQTYLKHLEAKLGTEKAALLIAVTGEIGNNSFDHNLGNWPDIPGIYFAHNEVRKTIVLADRGQGILKTISRVMPQIDQDKEALDIAFTKTISGRSPEQRGNGLKFVVQIIKSEKWSLRFDSGGAFLNIKSGGAIKIEESKRNIRGCFAVIKY